MCVFKDIYFICLCTSSLYPEISNINGIYFDDISKNLLGWQIFENNNEQINIEVLSFKKILDESLLESNLFRLTNKMIEEGVRFYGPYKRKVKKLLKNK